MDKKTGIISNSLLWFGASVSIAEILTGAIIAPLGFSKGLIAILIGHTIGFVLMYLAGLIGAKTELASIKSSRISFGKYGSYGFSIMNILQLIGWTAVMIIGGGAAIDHIVQTLFGYSNVPLWSMIIGLLIIVWVLIGVKNLGKVNIFAVGGLFVLTIILSSVVFKGDGAMAVEGQMSFGTAIELSVAMPLSWLPLISDYTKYSKKPISGTLASAIAYFIGSSWMYIIGLGAAIYVGNIDIAVILLASGLGVAAMLIVTLSTVTTTYLDVYSSSESYMNIDKKAKEKIVGVIVCIVGTVIAIFTPITQYESFLLLIGSVFAPMITILIVDFYIFKKQDISDEINVTNLIVWAIGFAVYRIFMNQGFAIGSTIPVIIVVAIICLIVNGIKSKWLKA